ncbi:MAG: Flp pilus assembly protein CpaB [Granulosicoccus sp.]
MVDMPHNAVSRRPRKNKVMFVLSLVLGVVGVFYSKHYIEQQIAYYKGQLDKTETMISVIVPTRKLLRGEVLSKNDILIREIPEKYADSNSVNESNFEMALGQQLDFDIDQGRPLLWAHLEGGLTPTFSGKVPDGLRAMTVRVDEINSISGFLQPNDRIDLLLSYKNNGDQLTMPLIQRLDVIATGVQTLIDKRGGSALRKFSTITVQVTPDQAQRITLAQEVGKLTAMLRNPDDESPISDSPMTVSRLLNHPEPIARPKTPPTVLAPKIIVGDKYKTPGIEYIIGGSS